MADGGADFSVTDEVNGAQWWGQIDRLGKNGFVKGVCDPDFFGIRQAAEPFRHTRGVFFFEVIDEHTIAIDRGEKLALLTDGIDGGPAQGYPDSLTKTETDSNKGGALSKRQGKFKIRGVGFRVLTLFTFSTVEADEGDKVDDDTWDPFETGTSRFLLDGTSIELAFQDEDCSLDLSNPSNWPQHAGPAGEATIVTNGVPVGPSVIEALRAVVLAGERDATDQAQFNLEVGRGSTFIRSNANIDLTTYPAGTRVGKEVDLIIYGQPVCSCDVCPVDFSDLGLTPEQTKSLKRRMGYKV
jgi:hypothetical protein